MLFVLTYKIPFFRHKAEIAALKQKVAELQVNDLVTTIFFKTYQTNAVQ